MDCKCIKKLFQGWYSYIISYLLTEILCYVSNLFYVKSKIESVQNYWTWKAMGMQQNMDLLFFKNNNDDDESDLSKMCTCILKQKQCNIINFVL